MNSNITRGILSHDEPYTSSYIGSRTSLCNASCNSNCEFKILVIKQNIYHFFHINYFNILDLAIWLVFSFTLFVVLCSVVSVALGDVGSMALKRMVVRKMVSLSIWHIGLCHLGMIFCVMDCLIFSVALLVVKRLTRFPVHCVVHLGEMCSHMLKIDLYN